MPTSRSATWEAPRPPRAFASWISRIPPIRGPFPASITLSADARLALVGAGGGGLHLVDILDPLAPRIAGHYETGDIAAGVAQVGSLAYVAGGSAGLHIVDISNPATPLRIGVYPLGEPAVDVEVHGAHAYVSGRETGLHAVDVSDPANPRRIGFAAMSGGGGPLAVEGRHAYVQNNWGPSGQGSGFSVVDVSDPANPRIVGHTSAANEVMDLWVNGDLIWVANTIGVSAFRIIGPDLRLGRDGSFQITGTVGMRYEIQDRASFTLPSAWTPVMEVTVTNRPQALELPPTSGGSSRMIRAAVLP